MFVAATAVAMFDAVQANRVVCVVKNDVEACERWWQGDPTTSREYWRNVWTRKGLVWDYWETY